MLNVKLPSDVLLYHGPLHVFKGNLADIDIYFIFIFYLLLMSWLVYAEYFKEPES